MRVVVKAGDGLRLYAYDRPTAVKRVTAPWALLAMTQARLAAAHARLESALRLLRDMEHGGPFAGSLVCPMCDHYAPVVGHAPDCALAAVLAAP
jgi:hypothetical protein